MIDNALQLQHSIATPEARMAVSALQAFVCGIAIAITADMPYPREYSVGKNKTLLFTLL